MAELKTALFLNLKYNKMNYYFEQLENLKAKATKFNPKIKIFANGNGKDTNFLDLNEESATALIEWLQKNYIKKP